MLLLYAGDKEVVIFATLVKEEHVHLSNDLGSRFHLARKRL